MANQGRFMRYAAAAGIALTLTAGCASFRTAKPMVDEKYSEPPAKVLFIPAYNQQQPNKIITEPTAKTKAFLDRAAKEHPEVNWKDANSAGAFLTANLHTSMPASSSSAKSAYMEASDNKSTVTPDSLFDSKASFCLEYSVNLAAAMKGLGFDARVAFLEEKMDDDWYEMHVLVEVKTRKGTLFLDPTYNIVADTLDGYYSKFVREARRETPSQKKYIYYPVPYAPEYEKYLNPEKEPELDGIFSGLKQEF